MKAAVAQLISGPDKRANLEKAERFIEKARKMDSDLILLPETFMCIPAKADVPFAEIAESLEGPFVTGLKEAARKNGIYVICGMYETGEGEKSRAYNTTVVINREGELIHSYRKTHLYDAFSYRETDFVIPGDGPLSVIETEFGKIGVLVCYELRYPEIMRRLVLKGAEFIFVPTAWMQGYLKEEQLEILLRARAVENTVYVCASDQVGNRFAGKSLIIDPMGLVLGSAGEEESIFAADLDPERIRRVREKNPCIFQRRTEFY